MNTRNGLKKIHTDFHNIYRKLDKAYTENSTNEKITGGIVGIWAKMSVDSLLRNKLIKEGEYVFSPSCSRNLCCQCLVPGLVSKILPLLDKIATRYVALQALFAITYHGSIEARLPIAKEATPTLIRLMEELPDDYEANDLVIGTLSNAVGTVLNEEHVDGEMLKLLNIPTILRLLLQNTQKPEVSIRLINHAYDLITAAAFHCHKEVKAIPPLIPLVISALRTTDIAVRCGALATLNRLNSSDAEEESRDYNMVKLDYALKSGYPEHLATLLQKYGPRKCEISLMLQCTGQHQRAMMRVAQDHDLCSLGRTLGGLITTTEFALSTGPCEMFAALSMNMNLPFRIWTDALPFCAKALRENGSRSDLDVADILDIKYDFGSTRSGVERGSPRAGCMSSFCAVSFELMLTISPST